MTGHAARFAEQLRNGSSDMPLRSSTFYVMVAGSGAPGTGTPFVLYTDRNKGTIASSTGQVTADSGGTVGFYYDGGLFDLYLSGSLFLTDAGVNDAADIGTQGGGTELAATTIATTGTASLTTSFVDIAGMSVAPTIGSRGIYVDVIGSFGSVTVKTLLIQLYDVTAAAAVCQGNIVTAAGAVGLPFAMRARLAPAAGARSYKVRWGLGSGTDTGAYYGADQSASTGIYVFER